MSVYCTVAYPALLIKALNALVIYRDCWATVLFTPHVVILHVEGNDLSSTATARLPRLLFSEYVVDNDPRFAIHVTNFIESLLLLGPAVLISGQTLITLSYSSDNAKLLIKLSERPALPELPRFRPTYRASHYSAVSATVMQQQGGKSEVEHEENQRVFQAILLTRPAKSSVLDLRFNDSNVIAQMTLNGDVLREIVEDVTSSQCKRVLVQLSAELGLQLCGDSGPFGSITVSILPHCDGVIGIECNISSKPSSTDNTLSSTNNVPTDNNAKTRLSTTHLAVACGAKLLPGNAFISAGSLARARNLNMSNNNNNATLLNPTHPHADPFLNYQAQLLNTANMQAGTLSGSSINPLVSLFSGFERVTLQINAQKQLSITHVQQENEIKVSVTIVVQPLYSLED